jgi:fatty-acid desaturase
MRTLTSLAIRIHHVMAAGWSHIGWTLTGTSQQHPEAVMRRYALDLMKDPVHVWLNRLYFMPLVLLGLVLFALAGWQWTALGCLCSCYIWLACHLARKLSYAHLGTSPIPDE